MSATRPGGEGGLVWAIGASGLAHGAALAFLALTPSRFEGMASRPESYSVALVAPSAVGGTHLPGPLGKKPQAPPRVPAAQPPRPSDSNAVERLPPPPAKEAEPAAKPPPPVKPPEAAKPEPALPAPEKKKPEAPKEPAVAKPPKQESVPPQPAKKEQVEAKPAEKKDAVKKKKPAEKKEEPVAAKKEELVTKKEKPSKEAEQPANKEEPAKAKVAEKKEPVPPKETKQETTKGQTEIDRRIAAAVERRAGAVQADSNQPTDVDSQIAAAVQRRTLEAARAASGIASSTSPVAGVGPGSGAGGVLRGIEYVMYRNQMESRIKAAWVWAGADRSLRAVVRFNVTEEGKIINVKTVQGSGDASYDASVERAIRAADPLGAPPEQYREEFGTVELEFRAEDARGG